MFRESSFGLVSTLTSLSVLAGFGVGDLTSKIKRSGVFVAAMYE